MEMFNEDDIVKYNGLFRVVERESSFAVYFKDCIGRQFSFAPRMLVQTISEKDFYDFLEDFQDNKLYPVELVEIFDKAITKYLSKHL